MRGLAVVAVVAFHLDLGPVRGGWVGVDVFFVLSGYLITSLLLDERARTGGVALGAFWVRRVRRLLPALLVVLAAVAVAGRFLGGAERYTTLQGDGLAALAYVANWRFITSAQSYFASFSPSPLRHTWSLAIEEQFYLLWPLTFLALTRLFRRRWERVGLLVAVAVASVWWTNHLAASGQDLSRAYYGSDTRLPTILAGCVAALVVHGRAFGSLRQRVSLDLSGAIGAVALVVVALAVPESSGWLYRWGGFAGIAVAAAAVTVAAAHRRSGPFSRLGTWRPLVHAGHLSYSLYLWHWPVIVFLDHPRVGWSPVPLAALQVAVSWLLAEVSYRFVEQPIRTGRVRVPRPVPSSLLAVGAVAVLFVTMLRPVASTVPPASGTGQRATGPTGASTAQVAVLGDSQAFVLAGTAPAGFPYRVHTVFTAQCDIIGDPIYAGSETADADPTCPTWPERWADAIVSTKPDVIVVTLGLRQLFDPEIGGVRLRVGSRRWEDAYRDALRLALVTIRGRTRAPILWLDVPCYRWDGVGGDGEEHDPARLRTVNRVLRSELGHRPGVTVLDYGRRVCDGSESDPDLRPDGVHLTSAAAGDLWTWLRPQIAARLHRRGP